MRLMKMQVQMWWACFFPLFLRFDAKVAPILAFFSWITRQLASFRFSSSLFQIETLVERLQTATRAEDRRDSIRGIKALSKRYRLEVGTQAMPACIEALSRDRSVLCSS